MRISRAGAVAGLLALAVAGCSSGSDSDSDRPDPAALASSLAAQATSPAAGSGSSGGGNCADAPTAAKAALTGMDYVEVGMVNDCAILSVVTRLTEPGAGKAMCDRAAGEVWQLGVRSIVVMSVPSGTELATADAGRPCTAG